jgi:hypothetical protein
MMVVWGVLTSVLIVLIIYRALLNVHEEDQLFLSRGEAAMAQEQVEVLKRIDRVDPLIRWVGIASGALLLFIAGLWLYQGLFTTPALE